MGPHHRRSAGPRLCRRLHVAKAQGEALRGDRQTDARAGKRTLAVRFGKRGALIEQAILFAIAYAVPIALVPLCGPMPLVALATLPAAVYLWRELWKREGEPLNRTLVGTARLLALHGALLTLGIALSG